MRNGAVRLAGRCVGLTVAVGMSAAAGAQQARTGLLVSTGASAETNPFSDARTSGGSGALTLEAQPSATFRSDRSTLEVRGLAQFRQFLRRYGLEDNYGVDTSLTTRASDRVTLRAGAGGQYNEGGFGGYGRPSLSPSVGVGVPPNTTLPDQPTADPTLPDAAPTMPSVGQLPLLSDVALLGQRVRTTSLYGSAGVDARLSGRSTIGADLDVRVLRFKGNSLSDFNSGRVGGRYSWQIDELTSIGVIGSVERIDYRTARAGDATIQTGQLSFERRFSRQWELSLGAGVSSSRIAQLPGVPNTRLTSLTVQGRFCWAAEYSRLCVSASRSPQPSAIGGVRVSDTAGVTYSQRLSDRQSVTLAGSYTRTGQGRAAAFAQPAIEFASGSARYDHQLGQRITFYASGILRAR